MNMISTGSFLTETGASNKQSELVKKLTAAWEKKNSKTARAGGASLMALSLAACGGEDNTPFSQADVDAAKQEGVASVDITSDNTDVMLAQADYDAAIEAAKTSNDADIAAAAKAEALTSADGTIYATVDAAYTAGSNVTNAAAVEAALTDASGVKHNNVDAAIASNDAAIETAATASAEAALVAGSGFDSVAALLAAYEAAVAPDSAAALSFTTSTDTIVETTGVSDTITGAFGTVAAADVLVDQYTTDSDVVNLTMGTGLAVTIKNIETINIDARDNLNADAFTVAAAKMSGYDVINITSGFLETAFIVTDVENGGTISFDNATAITFDMKDADAVENKGDAATVELKGGITATLDKGTASGDDVDALTIKSTGSTKNTVTLDETEDYLSTTASDGDAITVTGDQSLVIKVGQETNAKGLDGATLTSNLTGDATLTIEVTDDDNANDSDLADAEIDLSGVDGIIKLMEEVGSGGSTDLKVKDGATIVNGAAEVFQAATSITSASASGTVNLNFAKAETSGTDSGIVVTVKAGTVNLANTASTAVDVRDVDIVTSHAGIGAETDINVATGAGIQISDLRASTGTLDAVTVTGGKDFSAAVITSNSVSADVEDFTTTGTATVAGAVDVTASKTVTLAAVANGTANTGSLTVNAAGNVVAGSTIGSGTDFGDISVTSTGGTIDMQGQIDTDGSVVLTADAALKTVGTVAINAVGTVDVTAGSTITLGATSASTVTLTAGNTSTNSTFDSITGNLVLNGNDVTYAGAAGTDTVTGNVTVQGGANLDFDAAGTNLITGTVTHTGDGTVTIGDLAGKYVGGDATGAVTIADTAAGASEIATGSKGDSITTGDVSAVINSGGGNDTVNAVGAAATKQVNIDGGSGNDTITGGKGVSDILTGGTGVDTFVWAENTYGGAAEKITDFTAGSAGDIIKVTATGMDNEGTAGFALDSTGAAVVKVDTTDATATTHANANIYLLTGTTYATADAAIAAMNGASGVARGADGENNMFVYADTDGHAYVALAQSNDTNDDWANESDEGSAILVQLTGFGLDDVAALTADNFTVA